MLLSSLITRRVALSLLPLSLLPPPQPAHADDALAVATFSAGDPRFLQPSFADIKYLGVKQIEVGTQDSVPAIRVAYDAKKLSYKRVVGTFWRSCDPTAKEQFGNPQSTIIWVAGDEQKSIAEESRRRLKSSTEVVNNVPVSWPMYKGRPILTEIRPVAGQWEAAAAADQDWYLNEAKAYEAAMKKSGRAKFLVEAFKPVTVTACQKTDAYDNAGVGTVCGFVCAQSHVAPTMARPLPRATAHDGAAAASCEAMLPAASAARACCEAMPLKPPVLCALCFHDLP